jgi:hypothetical protein
MTTHGVAAVSTPPWEKQDIEEHEYTTRCDPARTVKIRLFLTEDGMDQSKWMKTFIAECTYDGVVVATTLAWQVPLWREMQIFT